jgi:hypothetical protein
MFPFLVGRRAVKITYIHLFIQKYCPGEHIRIGLPPPREKGNCKEEGFVGVIGYTCGHTLYRKIKADFGPISGHSWHNFGHLRLRHNLPCVEEAYLFCEYYINCADNDCRCNRCCTWSLGEFSRSGENFTSKRHFLNGLEIAIFIIWRLNHLILDIFFDLFKLLRFH